MRWLFKFRASVLWGDTTQLLNIFQQFYTIDFLVK